MAEIEPDGVFDTNILIDQLNGVLAARQEMRLYAAPAISIVTWIELVAGARHPKEAITASLLEEFTLVPITLDIAQRAAEIRKFTRLKLPDAVILATAEVLRCPLVTRNTRDFAAGDPRIRIPYRL